MKGTRLQQVAIFQNISEGWIELQMKGTRLQQVAIFQNISSAATQIAVLAILNRAWQAVPAFEEIEQ